MNITQQTENTICIELTQDDMTELDITYDELDYANIETRRVLWTLLDEAKHKLGKSISLSQKMLIEAMPEKNGGCKLYFTLTNSSSEKKQIIKQQTGETLCQSEKIDNLCALSRVLKKIGGIKTSELYSNGKTYRLFLQPAEDFHGNLTQIVSEFCTVCDKSKINFTREHYKPLASPDALKILSSI